mmetsp:Transcript_18606/g.47655  ORF Transcript_18606/g.47655 Transcript_18606/m.47655 type:complete len:235 (+) Transcript_18606:1519-2223(+)
MRQRVHAQRCRRLRAAIHGRRGGRSAPAPGGPRQRRRSRQPCHEQGVPRPHPRGRGVPQQERFRRCGRERCCHRQHCLIHPADQGRKRQRQDNRECGSHHRGSRTTAACVCGWRCQRPGRRGGDIHWQRAVRGGVPGAQRQRARHRQPDRGVYSQRCRHHRRAGADAECAVAGQPWRQRGAQPGDQLGHLAACARPVHSCQEPCHSGGQPEHPQRQALWLPCRRAHHLHGACAQ